MLYVVSDAKRVDVKRITPVNGYETITLYARSDRVRTTYRNLVPD